MYILCRAAIAPWLLRYPRCPKRAFQFYLLFPLVMLHLASYPLASSYSRVTVSSKKCCLIFFVRPCRLDPVKGIWETPRNGEQHGNKNAKTTCQSFGVLPCTICAIPLYFGCDLVWFSIVLQPRQTNKKGSPPFICALQYLPAMPGMYDMFKEKSERT